MRREFDQHSDDAFARRVEEFVLIEDLEGGAGAAVGVEEQTGRISHQCFDRAMSIRE